MDDIDKEILHQRELKARRAAWEEQRQAEAEEEARREARGRLDAFLTSRRQAWIAHTGELPTSTTVEGWKHEFVADRLADEQTERAERLLDAANNAPL